MSIYDKRENIDILNGLVPPKKMQEETLSPMPQKSHANALDVSQNSRESEVPQKLDENYSTKASTALEIVDDVVMKNYLTKLSNYDILDIPEEQKISDNITIFKINKMVYEKDEYATDKFVSVINAMTNVNVSVFLIVDGNGITTDFYLGVKSEEGENKTLSSIATTLQSAITGQFPGIDLKDLSVKVSNIPLQNQIIEKIQEANSISTYVGIPAKRTANNNYTNQNYIQGMEKFADAMKGKKYTAIVLASNLTSDFISSIRNGYENVYSDISVLATQQLSYSSNESSSHSVNKTESYSDTKSSTISLGESESETNSETEENAAGKAARFCQTVGGALSGVGGVETFAQGRNTYNFAPSVSVMGCGGSLGGISRTAALAVNPLVYAGGAFQIAGAFAALGAKTLTKTKGHTSSLTKSEGESHTDSYSLGKGITSTQGNATNLTFTMQNKHIQEVLKKIDRQLERLDVCESNGLWSTSCYFISYEEDRATAEIAASIFRSIMQGEQSGVEISAVNSWNKSMMTYDKLAQYVFNLAHPIFKYQGKLDSNQTELLPTSLISSTELAMFIGLPRKSVPGFPVIEHVSLGQEVVKWNSDVLEDRATINMGCIYNQGKEYEGNIVPLDVDSLCQHTFITGSTGCGKSNATFHLINEVLDKCPDCKFLIVEPAKGEYKDTFGNFDVYGTNPKKTKLLRINPFSFPSDVHVLEHVDRLIEIFNVCWPLYAAMPAVLKDAILKSYEDCGWDLYMSENKNEIIIYPTFADLLLQLDTVISGSEYSEEVKSNYRGALLTRVKTLCNGINRYIFCSDEIGDSHLFDENIIVDLSLVGSLETTSLIMGLLIIKLNEYRMNEVDSFNHGLRHLTILEEAHNILKSTQINNNPDTSNISSKSVEILSKAIAEMRAYGEGFIIVDQSPQAVDISAIRNTNTKIIMRLPEESDRRIAGKSAALEDNQLSEIAKLQKGVAVIYQNDWESPVLCKIPLYKNKIKKKNLPDQTTNQESLLCNTINFLLHKHCATELTFDIDEILANIEKTSWPSLTKIYISTAIKEYQNTGNSHIWDNTNYYELSCQICEIICSKHELKRIVDSCHRVESINTSLEKLISNNHINLPSSASIELKHLLLRAYVGYEIGKTHILDEWKNYVLSLIR